MDGEQDQHYCIVCNETIYGLINYVLHRKNSCVGTSVSDSHSNLVNDTGKHIGEKKSLEKVKTSEVEAEYDQEGPSHLEKSETSLFRENNEHVSILTESDNNDGGTRLLLERDGKTSLQNTANQNRSEIDFHVQSVVGNSADEHHCLIEPSENDWEKIPNDIKEVLLNKREKSVELGDLDCKGDDSETDLGFDETEQHEEVDTQNHLPGQSEFGILSINVAGEANKPTFGGNKKNKVRKRLQKSEFRMKKKSLTGQCERNKGKSTQHSTTPGSVICEVCNIQITDYPEYLVHKVEQHMGEATDGSKIEEKNSYIKVKVEEGTVMQEDKDYCGVNSEQQEEVIKEEVINLNDDDTENRIDDVNDTMCEPDEKLDNSDFAEKNNNTKEDDTVTRSHYCTVCDKKFSTKHNLVRHLITPFHKKNAVGKEEEYFSLLKKHQVSIVRCSPFRCDICSFYFNDHKYLEEHLISMSHSEKAGDVLNVMCSLCNFSTNTNESLISHVLSPSHVTEVGKIERVCAIKFQERIKVPKKQSVCKVCPTEVFNLTPNKSHFMTKEHIRWMLASEKDKMKTGLQTEEGVNENNQETELCTDEDQNGLPHAILHADNVSEENRCQNVLKNGIGTESASFDEMSKNEVTGLDMRVLEKKFDSESVSQNKCIDLAAVSETVSQRTKIGQASHSEKGDQAYSLKKASACKYCAFETNDYNLMRPHYMKEHAKMVKICEVCEFVFPHGKGYKLHVNSKDHQANIKRFGNKSEAMFECHVCKKKFADEGYCKFHTAYYHYHQGTEEKVLRENKNSITRDKYSDFLTEIEELPNNHVLTCPECGSQIKKLNMLGHLRKHTGEKPFVCNICTLSFYNSSSLRRHLLVHYDCLEKTCEICGEKFSGLTSYNVHMDIHKAKNTSSEKTNVCHICGETFYIKRQLRMHMKKHAAKDFKCDVPGCLWAFSNQHALKCHKLTHSDENPFICPTCGYSTKSWKYLKSHEKIHSKEKLLKCEHCPYQTIKTTHLRRHMRIHLGTKPYKCPYCSYACNTHDNIRKHILETSLHRGLKVYPCKLCSYATNCTKEFRTHLLTKHTEVTAEDIQGASLAAFTGLFNKEEDIQTFSEGMQILPCKHRKTSRRKIQPDGSDKD